MEVILKDKDAIIDWGINWADWVPSGDALSAAAWTITGPDANLTEDTSSISGDVTTIFMAGGTFGRTYTVTCRVTSTNGLIDDRSFRVRVDDR